MSRWTRPPQARGVNQPAQTEPGARVNTLVDATPIIVFVLVVMLVVVILVTVTR